MSTCGNCGGSSITCTCYFIDGCAPDAGGEACAHTTGNGSTSAPINYRPENVPLPRPLGFIGRETSGSQAIGANATAAVIFDTDFFDDPTVGAEIFMDTPMVNLVGAPTRLTATSDGYYITHGYINATGENYYLRIRKNGTEYLGNQEGVEQSDGALLSSTTSLMTIVSMVVGDYIELVVTSRGTAVTILTGFDISIPEDSVALFFAQWVRAL